MAANATASQSRRSKPLAPDQGEWEEPEGPSHFFSRSPSYIPWIRKSARARKPHQAHFAREIMPQPISPNWRHDPAREPEMCTQHLRVHHGRKVRA
jgi:hypothetical protein